MTPAEQNRLREYYLQERDYRAALKRKREMDQHYREMELRVNPPTIGDLLYGTPNPGVNLSPLSDPNQQPPQPEERIFGMNLSCSIFLVNAAVRAVRVSYDPDTPRNNNPNRLFKTFDESIAKDDYVVVPTSTRHGFTVCKVEEVGFRPDLDGGERWDWVVGKVDTPTYDRLVDQEKTVLDRIGDVEYNRKKKELADAMGLADVSLTDLDLVNGRAPSLPAAGFPDGPCGGGGRGAHPR